MAFSSDPNLQTNQLPISLDVPEVKSENFQDFLQRYMRNIANIMNTKEGALYNLQEVATFQQYFFSNQNQNSNSSLNFRPVYRTVIDTGVLPNTGTKAVAHNIPFDSNYRLTNIYGAATDPISLIYVPLNLAYASPQNISLYADGTFIYITTFANRSNFTSSSVVLEYTKIPN